MDPREEMAVRNATALADKFVYWQAENGGVSLEKCAYQRPGRGFGGGQNGVNLPFMAEALYKTYEATGTVVYKEAADNYCRFFVNNTEKWHPTWQYGLALKCVSMLKRFNQDDSSLGARGREIFEWALQRRRNDGPLSYGYFTCGYNFRPEAGIKSIDVGWTNDLGMFAVGVMAYYETFRDRRALDNMITFSRYFLDDWVPNASDEQGRWGAGTWSKQLGTWLIGPYHYTGFENTDVYGDEAGWVFSSQPIVEFLSQLYKYDAKPSYREKMVRSMKWCFDACQFPDGGIGICGRDDKWIGTTGATLMQYYQLVRQGLLSRSDVEEYRPKAVKAREWLINVTDPDRFPADGVIYVNKQTFPNPGVNVVWLMAWGTMGLLLGPVPRV